MKWIEKYPAYYYFADHNGVIKPAYIDRYMQETGYFALKNLGPTPEYLDANNFAFILSKICFKFYMPIYEGGNIEVQTWARDPKALTFQRNYRIIEDGVVMAEADSSWVLFHTKEKKILKPTEIPFTKDQLDDEDIGFTVSRRLKLSDNMHFIGSYKVKYSDLDSNRHMNNTRYLDLICDYAEHDCEFPFDRRFVSTLEISHVNEARFGDEIELFLSNEEPARLSIRAKIKSSGLPCFDAYLEIKNL